eukprot:6343207-Amphidinium_carterae.1
MSSKSAIVNSIARVTPREAALVLAPRGRALEGLHINSSANRLADALSRMAEGYSKPLELANAPYVTLAKRGP